MSKYIVGLAGALWAMTALAADAPKANLQVTMLTKVNPQGLALWQITNNAIDNKGDIDAKKLKAADWASLLEIGRNLEAAGQLLAASNGIIAAPPGAKLQDEGPGGFGAADVQRFLNAKPALFRTHAQELQKTGASIVEAVNKRSIKLLGQMSDSLDTVCENCHKDFWYPEPKK